MRTTTPDSARSLSVSDLAMAVVPRSPLAQLGRRYDRVNACKQARLRGFPRLHTDRVRDIGQAMDADREMAHKRVWKSVRARGMVMLTGDRGRGKTHLATLVACEWLSWGFGGNGQPRYWRLADLFADQKAWFDRKHDPLGNRISEPLAIARECGLLVLDELQERIGSDWEQAELVRCLDTRYAEGLPTLLITNRTPEQAAGIVGVSAIDRMKEGGALIECRWNNMRDAIRAAGGAT